MVYTHYIECERATAAVSNLEVRCRFCQQRPKQRRGKHAEDRREEDRLLRSHWKKLRAFPHVKFFHTEKSDVESVRLLRLRSDMSLLYFLHRGFKIHSGKNLRRIVYNAKITTHNIAVEPR